MAIGHDRSLIDYVSEKGAGVYVEGIVAGEANFYGAAVILQDVNSAAKETAVEQNVAGRSLHANIVHYRLNQLEIATDGIGVEPARAARANQRASDGLDDEVPFDVLQSQVCGYAIE